MSFSQFGFPYNATSQVRKTRFAFFSFLFFGGCGGVWGGSFVRLILISRTLCACVPARRHTNAADRSFTEIIIYIFIHIYWCNICHSVAVGALFST